MKKLLVLSLAFLSLIMLDACKKDPKTPPDNGGGGGGEYTTTDVKVVLPEGSNVDLSKTKIWTMTQTNPVGADGKATIPFMTDGCELAFLTDASDNVMMMGFIHKDNKEITTKTTAQVLLYFGLGFNVLPADTRLNFLKQSAFDVKLSDYYSKLEAAFKTDPLVIEKQGYKSILNEAFERFKTKPVDIYARQNIDVEDDMMKSSIEIEKKDDEHIDIHNYYYRRAYAFIYKTAFKDQNNNETVIHTNIDYNDAADKDIKVLKAKYNEQQAGGSYATGYKCNKATTGPVELLLASNEKEATYKIRVLGPGAATNSTLTEAEKAKLEELYYEYLAYDQIAPYLLDVTGYRTLIATINEDHLKPFYEKVKAIAQLNHDEIMFRLKRSTTNNIPQIFFSTLDNAGQSRAHLVNTLFECFKKQHTTTPFPSAEKLGNDEKQLNKFLDFTKLLIVLPSDMLIFADPYDFNEMEEFTVKAKDNDVKISPRKSDVMAFTNHPLTVETNPSLGNGETIEYEWTTAGNFGVLKNGSTEGTSFTTTTKTINYYGKTTPNEDNIEKVVVTVYVKSSGGARIKYGADTATINVKKVKRKITPNGATLSPKNDVKSVKLYLQNADGKDPLVDKNDFIDFQVNWSTPGSYGHFSGGVTQTTTSVNNINYTATDDEVEDAVENITATLQFRQKLNGVWSAWYDYEAVKGKVKINNEPKKKIYWVKLQEVHTDSIDIPAGPGYPVNIMNCQGRGVAYVDIEPDAIKYSVRVMGTFNGLWDGVHNWTPGNHPAWWIGYGHPRGITSNQYTVAASVTRAHNYSEDQPNHDGVPFSGMAEVTVWLK